MRTIGLIGGMSWESNTLHCQAINREVAHRKGALKSTSLHLVGLNLEGIANRRRLAEWPAMVNIPGDAARRLEPEGAEFSLLLSDSDTDVPPFDTTEPNALAAVDFCLQ